MEKQEITIKREIIDNYMKENKISLNKLANQIEISPATLCRILSGQRRAGQLVIGKMLNFFNVKFEELFFYKIKLTNVNKTST